MKNISRKSSSTRNPIARILKHFTPKRFKDKTKYKRNKNVYRCVSCGTDNEQKVNGVISYMPIKAAGDKLYNMNLVENNEDGS